MNVYVIHEGTVEVSDFLDNDGGQVRGCKFADITR